MIEKFYFIYFILIFHASGEIIIKWDYVTECKHQQKYKIYVSLNSNFRKSTEHSDFASYGELKSVFRQIR